MQSRVIRRLARKLRSTYRKTKSLRKTSELCKIFTDDGRVNSGLVKRIAFDEYEPSAEVIERFLKHGAIEQKKKRCTKPIQKDLIDMTEAALLKALKEREPMPDINFDPKVFKAFIKACNRRYTPNGAKRSTGAIA